MRNRRAVVAAAIAVGALVIVTATPATASDNSKDYADCTVTAKQVTKDSLPSVTARGNVLCNSKRNLTLNIQLQRYNAGWYTIANKTVSVRPGYGLTTSANAGCTPHPSYYRTRAVATISGTNVTVASTEPSTECHGL